MQLGRLGVVLATCAGAAAQANEKPGVVDGTKIFQSRVGVQTTRVNWEALTTVNDGLGTHEAAILGYKLQLQEVCEVTSAVSSADNVLLQTTVATSYGDGTPVDAGSVSCDDDYAATDTEPVCAMVGTVCVAPSSTSPAFPTTSRMTWLDVTGVYTPTSGQNHDGACEAACAMTACSDIGDGGAVDVIAACSGCMPQNAQTDVGCFPGATGFPTSPNTFHDVGGLQSGKYYRFRVKAYNVFGEGEWSAASYAVHMHATPNAPTWQDTPVLGSLDGTELTLQWAAPDNFGRGSDQCDSVTDRTNALSNLHCARSNAAIFDACDLDDSKTIDNVEQNACACLSCDSTCINNGGAEDLVTYNRETCTTQGTAAASADSASSSGISDSVSISYEVKMCSGSSCTPTSVASDPTFSDKLTTTKLVQGLTAGTTYRFTITASNAAGSGAASTIISFTTAAVPVAPSQGPTVRQVADTSMTVTWAHLLDQVPAGTALGELTAGTYSAGFVLYAQSCNQDTQATCDDANSDHWSPAARSSLTTDGADQIAQSEHALGRASANSNEDVGYQEDSDSVTHIDATTGKWLKLTHFGSQSYTDGLNEETYSAPHSDCDSPSAAGCPVDTVTVQYLAQGTHYRFMLQYVNAAGSSAFSAASAKFQTLDSQISDLRIYSGPPCVYQASSAARKTTFAASAAGTNVRYSWELVSESVTGTSVLYSGEYADPGGSSVGTCKDSETVCSVMEYEFPYPGVDAVSGLSNYDEIKLRVLAYNKRGIVTEEVSFGYVDDDSNGASSNDINTIEYCGCTDNTDPAYWSDATYMIPSLCTSTASFASTTEVTTVTKEHWEYFQFFFQADTYSAEVTLRVDVGSVDVYVGTEGVPDASQSHTFSSSQTGVSNFYIASVPYAGLSKSTTRSVYVAVKGASSFSRIQVLGRTSDFGPASRVKLQDQSTMAGTCTAAVAATHANYVLHTALCSAVTALDTDTACAAVQSGAPAVAICTYTKVGIAASVKALSYDFYEFFYPHADNDLDIQITVQTEAPTTEGGVIVYASTQERYPGPSRATDTYSGYWLGTSHTGPVNAGQDGTFTYTIRPQTNTGQDGTLYVAIQGRKPSNWALGDSLPATSYTIKAKVFRYRIESALLEPGRPIGVTANDATGGTATDEDRYSVVSPDNFNYYEIKVSKATFNVKCTFEVHYGSVKVITSSTSLPTQDTSLLSNAAGTVIGTSNSYGVGSNVLTIEHSHMNVESGYVYVGIIATSAYEASYDIVVAEQTFGVKAPTDLYSCEQSDGSTVVATSCTTGLPPQNLRRRVPALGGSTDGAPFTISGQVLSLTQDGGLRVSSSQLHPSIMKGQILTFVDKSLNSCNAGAATVTVDSVNNAAASITVVGSLDDDWDNNCDLQRVADVASSDQMTAQYYNDERDGYHFFQLYVGPQDVAHEAAARTSAGSLPSDISTDPDSWGLDWTTPFTQTWKDSKTDEWDLDLDIAVTGMAASGMTTGSNTVDKNYQVFASTREKYPSAQRSYDEAVVSSTVANGGNTLYSVAGAMGTTFSTTGCTQSAGVSPNPASSITTVGACINLCDAAGASDDSCNAIVYDADANTCEQFLCTSHDLVNGGTANTIPYKRNEYGTSSMTLPHYTFSGSMVYISVFLPCPSESTGDCVYKLAGDLVITATDKSSGRTLSADATIAASRCTSDFCNGNGNCIDDPQDGEHAAAAYCICDDGWTGAHCQVGNQWGAAGGPTIATNANILATVETGHFWAPQTSTAVVSSNAGATLVTLAVTEPAITHYYVGATIELVDTDQSKSGTAGVITSYDVNRVAGITWAGGTAPTGTPDTGTVYKIATACRTGNIYNTNDNRCTTANTWDSGTSTCQRKTYRSYANPATTDGAAQHVWEPYLSIGKDMVVVTDPADSADPGGCTTLFSTGFASDGDESACQTLCDSNSKCNAFSLSVTGGSCELHTCPKGFAQETEAKTGFISYVRAAYTCCAHGQPTLAPIAAVTTNSVTPAATPGSGAFGFSSSNDLILGLTQGDTILIETVSGTCPAAGSYTVTSVVSNTVNVAESVLTSATPTNCKMSRPAPETCPNTLPGVYDEAACETVPGATTQAACEQTGDTTGTTCSIVANVASEAACTLTSYAEIPAATCPPAAVAAQVTDCDAFDPVLLDCATQKCTPTGTNPYKIGYVSCPGGICTINAPKPVVEIPYSVKNLPAHAKVVAYVDSNPYPSKGSNVVNYVDHCESSDAACIADPTTRHFADSSIKIYDLKPLSADKKHTLVLMLLTESGEPLGTEVKQFQVGYGGGCSVAPDGSTCGGNGACYLGYCVCYDGWYGSACSNSVEEDGSTCAQQNGASKDSCEGASAACQSCTCSWSTTTVLTNGSPPASGATDTAGICTASLSAVSTFKAGDAYEKRVAQLTQSKLGEARFLNTRMLESTSAAIMKSNKAMTTSTTSTNSKLKTHAATVQTELSTTKAATQAKVDALYAKMERNAIVIQQAREESLRSQTSNLEAKLELQRALADHQTQVQNRFQTKRFGVYKLNALKQDKLKQEFARSRFTINQLKTANGPMVDTTKFKESTCTTDQFYNVVCTESTSNKQSLYTGTGYVSAQTVPSAATTQSASPVVTVDGANVPGTYNSVLRG